MRRRIAAALLAALLLTGCAPAAEPAAEPAEPAGEPVYMALTFDDGPSPAWTPRLLEGLSRRGARATFFLVGSQIEGREDLVRRIRQEGHQIGSHSFSHRALTELSTADALADLEKCDRALRQVLGDGSYWLRPPLRLPIGPGALCPGDSGHLLVRGHGGLEKPGRGQHSGHCSAAGGRRGHSPAPRLLRHQRHGGPGDRGPLAAQGGAVRHGGGAVRRQGSGARLRDPVPPGAGRINPHFVQNDNGRRARRGI